MQTFDDRILLQRRVVDRRGRGPWQTIATLPAHVAPIAGEDGAVTQKIVIRAYPTISADMRVIHGRSVLRILAIAEEDHGARMALACSEVPPCAPAI